MPPRLDDALSPELVLVDPGLRARARAAMVVPHWAPSSTPEPPPEPEPVIVAPEPPRRRSRIAAPVGTLVATAAASLIVSALSNGEQASGVVAVEWDRSVATATAAPALSPPGTQSVESPRVAGSAPAEPVTEGETTGTDDASSTSVTTPSPRSGRALSPARDVAVSSRTLGWPRSARASAYDVELVRDGSVIFTTRSSSSQAVLPRTWRRDGVSYAIQPEDQAFVWPVADGRRIGEPVVNGALALDLTLISRFAERGSSTTYP